MSNLKVLVVGASIAGPMTAYWLAKAGASVTVIERFPQLRTAGQAIDIRTTGVTVMNKIPGMEATVRNNLYHMDGMSFVDGKGRPYGVIKATGDPKQQTILSEYEILRGDLSRILFDLTKDNPKVKYVFGEQVASMRQRDNEPVTVEFANGLPSAEYDLVVACDGATSRTRALGFSCSARDHVHSLNWWIAYFTVKRDLLNGGRIGLAHSVPGGRKLIVGPGVSGGSRIALMGIGPRDAKDATLPFREAAKQGDDALKRYLTKEYDGFGWLAEEAFNQIWTADDFYGSEMLQVKVPNLYKGRFALVGDAGYATGPTGTGTSLAIAGAYVLAGEVCKHKGDLEAGLRAYEERMKPIIEDMQQIPPGVTSILAPQTAWGVWIRNMLFAFVAWGMSYGSLFAWMSGFWSSAFGSDKYGLPDYEWVE